MKNDFCIGIATCDNTEMLKKCLDAILPTVELGPTEIIIVNNGGQETEDLVVRGSHLRYIWNDKSIGVGASYNSAFANCTAPYFVSLNDDYFVKDPRWLRKMKAEFDRDPLMAAVGVRGGCSEIDPEGLGCCGPDVEYVEGSCMMVRTDIVRSLPGGLFDPVYRYGYFEDSDLSLRLRKRGYHIGLIDLDHEHVRAVTTGRDRERGVDVTGYELYNQQIFKKRWRNYLSKRNFKQKIAIRRSGAIGDVIFLTAILREIKRRNAEAEITVFTDYPDVLVDNSDVAEVKLAGELNSDAWLPSKDHAYDRVIDLDGAYEYNTGLHIIDAFAQACGLDKVERKTYLYPDGNSKDSAMRICGSNGDGKWATIHPHTGQEWLGRNPRWPVLQGVWDWLLSNGWSVVLLGSKSSSDDMTSAYTTDLRGKTTLREAFAIIERANLFFGVDSALMNAAQAFEIPTVGIFGAMNPEHILLSVPWVTALTAPRTKVGCLGCHEAYGVAAIGRPGRCMRETDICMEKIELYDAIQAIEKVLAANKQ